jgi:hypothetical protein
MNPAVSLGMTPRAQQLGVTTARWGSRVFACWITATRLVLIRVGCFNTATRGGSLAQRMDPTASSILFFTRLQKVQGWEQMTPSAAAHAVQVGRGPEPLHDVLPGRDGARVSSP